MSRRALWVLSLSGAIFWLALGVGGERPLAAQQADGAEIAALDDPAPGMEAGMEDSADGGMPADALLADEELMLLGDGYTYDPGERRDPFRSLLIVRERSALRGPRPEGIPGLLIDEIDLTGIFVTGEGPVAQVRSTEAETSYLLREGDQLYDGDVISISASEVVFKQIVDDPTAVKPFREVVKELDP